MTSGHRLSFLDKIVFGKLKAEVGGRVRYMVCGGAALAPEVCQFMQTCFSPVLQGYGLTETCGPCSIQEPSDVRIGSAGPPSPCVEMKLVDVPDIGYTSHDQPCARGEVYIRGKSVASGYLKNEEETSKAFVDGWFKTGDVGVFYPDGTISIIDRVKNLVKPPHGEYIALEKLESCYRKSNMVEQMLLYADTKHNDCVAVVVPASGALHTWASENGLGNKSMENLCRNSKANEAVLKSLQETGWKSGLKAIEMIKAVVLTPEEWTSDNGFMTAANKLKRSAVSKHFAKEIDQLYANLEKQRPQD